MGKHRKDQLSHIGKDFYLDIGLLEDGNKYLYSVMDHNILQELVQNLHQMADQKDCRWENRKARNSDWKMVLWLVSKLGKEKAEATVVYLVRKMAMEFLLDLQSGHLSAVKKK